MILYIKLEGQEFKYQIEDVARLFLCDEEIIFCENEPPEDFGGIFLSGSFGMQSGRAVFELGIKENRAGRLNCLSSMAIPLVYDACGQIEHENRKAVRRIVKKEIYRVLSECTGKKMPWGILTGIRPAKIVHELMEKNMPREDILNTLTQYYMLSEDKAVLLYEVACTERSILEKTTDDLISLYIGIPFCTTRCVYCSFTSNPTGGKYGAMVGDYIKALKAEISGVRELIRERGYKIQSLYIGGGTPTAIQSGLLKELLEFIEETFDLSHLEEYTLEAGRPDTIDEEKLKVIKDSKVSRISINPQTMNDETLKVIGRNHTSKDIINAVSLARRMGFDNINMDVIIGLPGESPEMFENTLQQIAELKPESLTVHTMAIKRASKLNEEKEQYRLISADEASYMIDMAPKYASDMGMVPYYLYRQKNMLGNLENIGYCKPGSESIYNIQIMEEKQTIIALGAGAITKVVYPSENRIERAFNVKSLEDYISRVEEMIERKKELLI